MKKSIAFLILVLAVISLAGCYTTSFEGDYVVRSGETLRGNIFATSGSVTLMENSRVTGSVILTSGELRIGKNAQVGGDVVLTSGALYMAEGSVVHGDVVLANRGITVRQAAGSTIEGQVSYNIAPYAVSTGIKSLVLLCVVPLILMLGLFLLLGLGVGRLSRRKAGPAPAPVSTMAEDTQQKLKQLKALLDEGLISQADYDAKKAEILAKM